MVKSHPLTQQHLERLLECLDNESSAIIYRFYNMLTDLSLVNLFLLIFIFDDPYEKYQGYNNNYIER